jgi:ribosomal protein S18 acetylase RimI-like enzyme
VNSSIESDDRFVADFASQCLPYSLRKQHPDDTDFLADLFIACSPLAGTLPPEMIKQQAAFQRLGHEASFPDASCWVVLDGEKPVGRIVIDWGDVSDANDGSHCVDIAVIPPEHGKGIGTKLLRAWISESSKLRRNAILQVLADNPAFALYERLGFTQSAVSEQPSITMIYRV